MEAGEIPGGTALTKIVLCIGMICAVLAVSASAAIRYVPGDYPTLQAGIDAAVSGDTVLVADGTYTGAGNKNVDFGGKAVLLRSANGPGSCVVDCQQNGTAFHFSSGEKGDSVLSGFTITNAAGAFPYGAVVCNNASPSILNCRIYNGSGYKGGGIHLKDSSAVVHSCILSGNSAGWSGGGIYISGGQPQIFSCVISSNSAASEGGGIDVNASAETVIEGVTFSYNTAKRGGGIYLKSAGAFALRGCEIHGNQASDGTGGGIFAGDSSALSCIVDCAVRDNTATGHGGGIHIQEASVAVAGSVLDGNATAGDGRGGGIFIESSERVVILNTVIRNNTSAGYGGAVAVSESAPALTNCLLHGNTAAVEAGALYAEAPQTSQAPVVTNCTLADNTTVNGQSAVFPLLISPRFTNCILRNNAPEEFFPDWGSPVVRYCNVRGNTAGEHNMDADPRFAGGGDYRLASDSPCRDSGTTADAPMLDILGKKRPRGAGQDIGSYEYTAAEIAAFPRRGPAPLTVVFENGGSEAVTSAAWTFGDGGTAALQEATHTYTAPGLYSVRLTVAGPAGTDSEMQEDFIEVLAPPPVPALVADPAEGIAPLTVAFTDVSTGAVEGRYWDFGDGGTAAGLSPVYTYDAAGAYDIALRVDGPGGSQTLAMPGGIRVFDERSDLNQDGRVDLADTVFPLQVLVGLLPVTGPYAAVSDLDGDGHTGMGDALRRLVASSAIPALQATALIGAAGGTLVLEDGDFLLQIDVPAGALFEDTRIQAAANRQTEIFSGILAGPVIRLMPEGLCLHLPATVTWQYDAADLPLDLAADGLDFSVLRRGSLGGWQPHAGVSHDSSGRTLRFQMEIFCRWGLMAFPAELFASGPGQGGLHPGRYTSFCCGPRPFTICPFHILWMRPPLPTRPFCQGTSPISPLRCRNGRPPALRSSLFPSRRRPGRI